MHPPTMAAAVVPHAMVPHSRCHSIRRCMRRRWEWGTMAAVVSNLRHNVSTDVVGLLWVVSYVGIHRVVYQTIGDASPMAPSASELSAWQPPCQMGRCATFADLVHHRGMMHCGGGVKEWGIEAGGDYSYSIRTCASIDDGGRHRPTVATGPYSRLLSIQQSTNIICDRTPSLKLEKVMIINVS